MTSLLTDIRVRSCDMRNFVPVSSLAYVGGINSLTNGVLATATWSGAGQAPGQGSRYTSSINGPGAGRLRDMGRTFISSNRTFRKVQLVVPVSTTNQSTGGVEGATTVGLDYLTGYIELGWDGTSTPAPVARTM